MENLFFNTGEHLFVFLGSILHSKLAQQVVSPIDVFRLHDQKEINNLRWITFQYVLL